MKVEKVSGAYFSPTGNTAKIVETIGHKMRGEDWRRIDLTRPDNRGGWHSFGPSELLIVGVPVYRGRVPEVMVEELSRFKGQSTPAIILVTYGNRMIEDAMLELKDIMVEQGFIPFGAASFSGQHSFNKEIGYNRPDEKDLKIAEEFAEEITSKLETLDKNKIGLTVPGNRPYKKVGPMSQMPFYPETDMNCIYCMLCSQYCPMEAISFSNPKSIDPNRCIRCTVCIKVCPVQAKRMTPGVFEAFVEKITTKNVLSRKEPWYYV